MFAVRHTIYNLLSTHMLALRQLWTILFLLFPPPPPRQWNALPDELRNITFPDFERRVRSLIRLIRFTDFGHVLYAYCFFQFWRSKFFLEDISYIE